MLEYLTTWPGPQAKLHQSVTTNDTVLRVVSKRKFQVLPPDGLNYTRDTPCEILGLRIQSLNDIALLLADGREVNYGLWVPRYVPLFISPGPSPRLKAYIW
jgi:hypothetical protein